MEAKFYPAFSSVLRALFFLHISIFFILYSQDSL